MSVFDLKPLSQKTIDELKLNTDHLWEIKIDDNIYGPFETLSLKHYSKENKQIMGRAFVSPMSVDNWRPFFEQREFLREDTDYQGPFWILMQGRKSSPLPKAEIAKRIELGTITRHDEISEDDGRHWQRISSHTEFEAHFTLGTALPVTPQESSFQKAKLKVLENLEAKSHFPDEKDNMASLTHVSLVTKEKTNTVKIEDIKIVVPKEETSGKSFFEHVKTHAMWAVPCLCLALYFTLSPKKTEGETAQITAESTQGSQNPGGRRSKKDSWNRTPASDEYGNSYDRSGVTQTPPMDDNYPTVIETHQEDQNYPDPDKEAEQVAEIQDQENAAEEHSLVQPNRDPAQDEGSLDATMNNEDQQPNPAVDQPVVEEVSDF